MAERVGYALFGFACGALVGVACWWLYGLAHSLNYDGPGMDPVLRHWVVWLGIAFAVMGFVLRARVGDVLGDALGGVFHFELNHAPGMGVGVVVGLVFLAIVIAALWFTVPA